MSNIYILIFIICILIIQIILYNLLNNNKINKITNDINNIYEIDLIYNQKNNPIELYNITKENINMYQYRTLINNLNNISKFKIKLKDYKTHNTYTQSTTGDYLRSELDTITNEITKIINNNGLYQFEKTNYGDIDILIDKENNKQIKYELFMWDKKTYFEIKFLIDIIKFNENIKTYEIYKNNYLIPIYTIFPCDTYTQLTPMDVIPTGNMVISNINKNECAGKTENGYIFLNSIIIQGSTLIINYNENLIKNNMIPINNTTGGVSDITLEYLGVEGDNNPIQDKAIESNKWIDLLSMPKWLGQFPCKSPPVNWDVDSIYHDSHKSNLNDGQNNDKINCIGTHWSPTGEPLQANYYPTLATLPRNCGRYDWMFNQSSDMPSYPTGGVSKH